MKQLILIFLFSVITLFATDPTHFSFTTTNKLMTIKIASDTELTFGSGTLSNGDEIGVFTQDGVCVGAVVWEEAQVFFNVYGRTTNPPVDGLEEGESMVYVVWDESEDQEYDSVAVTHTDFLGNPINDEFDTSVPYKEIATFNAFKLEAPVLDSPINNSTGQNIDVTLGWNTVDNALSYNLLLSENSDMSNPIINETGITTTSYSIPNETLDSLTKYYWQVQAVRNDHLSIWSETWNFKTIGNSSDKIVSLTLSYRGYDNGTEHKKLAVLVELRTGTTLLTSDVEAMLSGIVDENGNVDLNFSDVADGDYWLLVRAGGFLPVCTPEKQSLSSDGITWDFTTSSSQSVLGTFAMQNVNGVWQIRPGDLDPDGAIGAFDINVLLPHLGKSVKSGIPSE